MTQWGIWIVKASPLTENQWAQNGVGEVIHYPLRSIAQAHANYLKAHNIFGKMDVRRFDDDPPEGKRVTK